MPTEGDTELQRYYLQQLKELKQKIDLSQPSEDSSGSKPTPTPSNNKSAQEREKYVDPPIDIKAMIRATPRPVPSPYIKERGDRHHAKFISILFKLNSPAQSQNKKPRTK